MDAKRKTKYFTDIGKILYFMIWRYENRAWIISEIYSIFMVFCYWFLQYKTHFMCWQFVLSIVKKHKWNIENIN